MYKITELLYFLIKTNKAKIEIFNCDKIKYKVYDYEVLTDFIVIECYYYDKEESDQFSLVNHVNTFNYFINKNDYFSFIRNEKIKKIFYV